MAERISTPSRTKEIIEANSFAFKKNFGQNFLIDSNILDNLLVFGMASAAKRKRSCNRGTYFPRCGNREPCRKQETL